MVTVTCLYKGQHAPRTFFLVCWITIEVSAMNYKIVFKNRLLVLNVLWMVYVTTQNRQKSNAKKEKKKERKPMACFSVAFTTTCIVLWLNSEIVLRIVRVRISRYHNTSYTNIRSTVSSGVRLTIVISHVLFRWTIHSLYILCHYHYYNFYVHIGIN